MKNILLLFLFAIVANSCSNNMEEPAYSYPVVQDGEIITRKLIISESASLKSGNNTNGFSKATGVSSRELNLDSLVHNYEFTGYTVKIYSAWVIDESDPNGGYYTDLEFDDIDLTDYYIEFETAGDFEVEVEHPDFDNKISNFKAYYEFEKMEFTSWPENEPLIIDMELGQHAVFLVYKSIDVYYTIEWLNIDKEEVVEYQPIYVQDNKSYEIEIKHKDENEIKQINTAGDKGTCEYYWVESIL